MSIERLLFRVKNRQVEEEAKRMVESLGIDHIEIRRDETVAQAWLEDYEVGKTLYGLEDIEEYLEELVK